MKRKTILKRRAAKLPPKMLAVAATKWSPKLQRGYRNRRLGMMGPASPVRHIQPKGEA